MNTRLLGVISVVATLALSVLALMWGGTLLVAGIAALELVQIAPTRARVASAPAGGSKSSHQSG